MTVTPRNLILLSVAALALLSAPLLSYAQDAATATATADNVEAAIVEDVTDLGDVIDLTEGGLGDEVVAAAATNNDDDANAADLDAASVESCSGETTDATTAEEPATESTQQQQEEQATPPPAQTGPFIDLFGEVLLSLEMVDETSAQVHQHYTNEILSGKKVVGLYFSADW